MDLRVTWVGPNILIINFKLKFSQIIIKMYPKKKKKFLKHKKKQFVIKVEINLVEDLGLQEDLISLFTHWVT